MEFNKTWIVLEYQISFQQTCQISDYCCNAYSNRDRRNLPSFSGCFSIKLAQKPFVISSEKLYFTKKTFKKNLHEISSINLLLIFGTILGHKMNECSNLINSGNWLWVTHTKLWHMIELKYDWCDFIHDMMDEDLKNLRITNWKWTHISRNSWTTSK